MTKTIHLEHDCGKLLSIEYDYDTDDFIFIENRKHTIKCDCGKTVYARHRCMPALVNILIE